MKAAATKATKVAIHKLKVDATVEEVGEAAGEVEPEPEGVGAAVS